MEKLINDIKKDFNKEITQNDPLQVKLNKLQYEYNILVAPNIFNNSDIVEESEEIYGSKENKKKSDKRKIELEALIEKITKEIEEAKNNKIFDHAFEWRFEFPEVLNDEGDFIGFDVVIGNPPYFIMTKNNTEKLELEHYLNSYHSIKKASSKNIFNLLIELGITICNNKSYLSMIVPEGLFETRSYSETIELFNKNGSIINITRIEGMVFDEANTGNVIFIFGKNQNIKLPLQKVFKKNQDLIDFEKNENPIISKIDKHNTNKLSDVCQLFKGMVVADRKKKIFEKQIDNLPDKFLLGNCISKWKIQKFFYSDYKTLSIIGGTKLKEKHDVSPRILIRRTGNFLCCAYLIEPALTESTLYSCWSIKEDIHNLFILGILHSKVADYYIKNKLVTNPQAFPQILMTDLQSFPIPLPTKNIHDSIKIACENRLMNCYDNNFLEAQIDQLVYELYGLTEEEISIVEKNY